MRQLGQVGYKQRFKNYFPENLAIIFTENPDSEGYSVVGGSDPALSTRIPKKAEAVLDVGDGTFAEEHFGKLGYTEKIDYTTGNVGKNYWKKFWDDYTY